MLWRRQDPPITRCSAYLKITSLPQEFCAEALCGRDELQGDPPSHEEIPYSLANTISFIQLRQGPIGMANSDSAEREWIIHTHDDTNSWEPRRSATCEIRGMHSGQIAILGNKRQAALTDQVPVLLQDLPLPRSSSFVPSPVQSEP